MRDFLPLPPRMSPGDPVYADEFNKLRDAFLYVLRELRKRTPCSSADIGHNMGAGGFTSFLKNRGGGGATAAICILGGLSADPGNPGKKKVKPGFISGGGTSIFLELDDLEPVAGDWLYVEVDWTASEEDGVLLEGGTMDAAEIKQAATLPEDDELTAESLTGKAYVPLGKWNDETPAEHEGDPVVVWRKWGCGSISIKFCPQGGFIWVRGDAGSIEVVEEPPEPE